MKWEFDQRTITLTGDSETLAGVNNIVVTQIDLAEVDESFSEVYRIPIPNNTEITSGMREATLSFELGGLYKRTVTVRKSNISCINVSEGYVWEIMNDSLNGVILRGQEEAVRAVSELNVRAVADLTDYGSATGIVTAPVKIYIDSVDGNSNVGYIGEYSVYVNIMEAPPEEEEGEVEE